VKVFLGTGTGTFSSSLTLPMIGPMFGETVGIGDFNGDGFDDIAATTFYDPGPVAVFLNNADWPPVSPAAMRPASIAAPAAPADLRLGTAAAPSLAAELPASARATGAAGVHTFTNTGLGETTLITPGDQSITATDTASGINGSATVTVTLGPLDLSVPKHDAAAKDLVFAALATDGHSQQPFDLFGPPALDG